MSNDKKNQTSSERSALMRSVRHQGTSLERKVWSIADKIGLIYENNPKDLPGSPDLANRCERWAIFVHGCFWHAHEGCKYWKIPKTNSDFWIRKFEKNKERDSRKKEDLEKIGYDVIILWQCQIDDEELVKDVLEKKIHGSSSIDDLSE